MTKNPEPKPEPEKQPAIPSADERRKACAEEIMQVLNRHKCALAPTTRPPQYVHSQTGLPASQVIITAAYEIVAMEASD